MVARYSDTKGKKWSTAREIREGFESINGFSDFGYPRLFQRSDAKLVAIYFWCSPEKPQTHIESTVFSGP